MSLETIFPNPYLVYSAISAALRLCGNPLDSPLPARLTLRSKALAC
jgi:hypothetical protein